MRSRRTEGGWLLLVDPDSAARQRFARYFRRRVLPNVAAFGTSSEALRSVDERLERPRAAVLEVGSRDEAGILLARLLLARGVLSVLYSDALTVGQTRRAYGAGCVHVMDKREVARDRTVPCSPRWPRKTWRLHLGGGSRISRRAYLPCSARGTIMRRSPRTWGSGRLTVRDHVVALEHKASVPDRTALAVAMLRLQTARLRASLWSGQRRDA